MVITKRKIDKEERIKSCKTKPGLGFCVNHRLLSTNVYNKFQRNLIGEVEQTISDILTL